MLKNELVRHDGSIYRILTVRDAKVLVIDCVKRTMPMWMDADAFDSKPICTEQEFWNETGIIPVPAEDLEPLDRKAAYERFTWISSVLPYIEDAAARTLAIQNAAQKFGKSEVTIRKILCQYLVFQEVGALAPRKRKTKGELTPDEKNMRKAINKYFYSERKNSLHTAFVLMLKDMYCDEAGKLAEDHPKFHQFRYFYYRKYRKIETYIISREGLSAYQRDHRPLLGDNVQAFAPNVGVGMCDGTVCDIYLVDDAGRLVGRPILVICVDAYSGLCLGYTLGWEGGVASLRNLMHSVVRNKVEQCASFGIDLEESAWPNAGVFPGRIVTDRGREYISFNYEQLCELGVTIETLPAFRADEKGPVERCLGALQDLYKPFLKGKGVVMPDFELRGAHDYRKDACLTLRQFETVLLNCIVYYNSKRIVEGFPFTKEMLEAGVKPYSNALWEWGLTQSGANLIPVSERQIRLTLLPRTTGTYGRNGLLVNKLRYKGMHKGFKEQCLRGGTTICAFHPENADIVYVIEDGNYIEHRLIEQRFQGMSLEEIAAMKQQHADIVKAQEEDNLQARIDLAERIEAVASAALPNGVTKMDAVRETRRKERLRTHRGGIGGEDNHEH